MTTVDQAGSWPVTASVTGSGEADAAAGPRAPATPGTRGRKPSRLLGIRTEIPVGWRIGFGLLGVAALLALWIWSASGGQALIRGPGQTWTAFTEMVKDGTFQTNLWASA
ncbi:MAG: hypothetical protein ACTHN0_14255, partial [Aquihabitans sp.]